MAGRGYCEWAPDAHLPGASPAGSYCQRPNERLRSVLLATLSTTFSTIISAAHVVSFQMAIHPVHGPASKHVWSCCKHGVCTFTQGS